MLTLSPTALVTPINAERLTTDALSPDGHGGWNSIHQRYNKGALNPSEWIVDHLETGQFESYYDHPYTPGTQGKYASSNFHTKNQVRAPNGDIYFGASGAKIFCYEFATQKVLDLGKVPNTSEATLYSWAFNHDGTKLYTGSNSANTSNMPCICSVDLTTRASHFIARIGSTGRGLPGFANQIGVDGTDWIVAIVGEGLFECIAYNLTTGAQVTLGSSATNSWGFIFARPEGWRAQIVTNYRATSGQQIDEFWVRDGVRYDIPPSYLVNAVAGQYTPGVPAPPVPARDVTPYTNPLVNPPQVDLSHTGHVLWRPFGDIGLWRDNPYTLQYTSPVDVDSMTLFWDGSLIGDAVLYQGWYRYDPVSHVLTTGDPDDTLTEGGARCMIGQLLQAAGYPNGVLVTVDGDLNVTKLGNFSNGVNKSGVKRAQHLVYSLLHDLLVMGGIRDREGDGGGVGSYNRSTQVFDGTHTGLDFYAKRPRVAVFDDNVLFGGCMGASSFQPGVPPPTTAQLVKYTIGLVEIERQTVVDGLGDTGDLYRTTEPDVVVGLSAAGLLYRWNHVTRALLLSVDLAAYGTLVTSAQNAAGMITAVFSGTNVLAQINPLTLVITTIGVLPNSDVSCIVQNGADVCLAIGPTIYVVTMPNDAIGTLPSLTLTNNSSDGVYYSPNDPNAVPLPTPPTLPTGVQTSDILTQVVPAGKVIITSVALPAGATSPGNIVLTGDAIDHFVVHDTRYSGTRFTLLVENTSVTDLPLTATFTYTAV